MLHSRSSRCKDRLADRIGWPAKLVHPLTAAVLAGLLCTLLPAPAKAADEGNAPDGEVSPKTAQSQKDSDSDIAGSDETAADGSLDGEELILARGEAIYRKACQECHGASGEGVEQAYAEPLQGDLTLGELTELIADTMPEEDPETCVAEDAAAVATFLYHAYYSEAAQVRNRPPRISMARLTGEQLRQSLADLFGHFHEPTGTTDDRGITGTYFKGPRWKKENKKLERVDATLDFDFGTEGPAEGIEPEEFYIQWLGSLIVNETGRYELVLRSSCSCIMYFGGHERVLVNNHVQSEGKEEFRRTLQLTAGRAYPLRIEFIQRKRKTKQPPAKISLSWVPPGGSEEIIPHRHLAPQWYSGAFPLQTKLPPDDRSYGYERGIAISRQWDESTSQAAIEFARIAVDELYPRYRRKHRKEPDENRAKLRAFLGELVEVAFRGGIDDATKTLYVDKQIDATEDDAEAIKRVVLASLKSPRFLYPLLDSDRSRAQRVANRLALVLFDSLPSDEWLLKAAEKNQLQRQGQVRDAAWKMVNDYRTRAKIRAFFYQWFDISQMEEITKDGEQFPGFDAELLADLKKSLDAFFDDVIWSDSGDLRQLLQADWMYTTDRMAAFYGDAWKPAEKQGEAQAGDLARSVSDSAVHVGVLTHPLLMSHLAHHSATSPIHRGVFLTRHVLGRVIRPPNAAFAPLNPDLHPDLTTRQRVELQTGEVNCQVCHEKINSLGFALEHFDAAGRFRSHEMNHPIDATGNYVSRDGVQVEFEGARELGDFLAGSQDCHRSFVESAFEHFVKQPIAAFGPRVADQLTKSFQSSGYNVRELIVSIAVIAAWQKHVPNPGT